jgi:mono/diheme cytochrome c family protein
MQKKTMTIRLAACLLALAVAAPAFADTAGPAPAAKPSRRGNGAGFFAPFPFDGGEAVYKGVCQGCHMPDAKGAQGAGMYPALAENPRLASNLYPVAIVLNGKNGMPSFGRVLDDAQIAAVVNYVRTHFGNNYTDAVSTADVKKISNRQ